jgi:hypothetical protein
MPRKVPIAERRRLRRGQGGRNEVWIGSARLPRPIRQSRTVCYNPFASKAEKGDRNKVRCGISCPAFTAPKWRNWQTRMVQVHVLARVWGFESPPRHQRFTIPPAMSNLQEGFFV